MHAHEKTYLALGDSYTIGEGVAEDGRWPMQLAKALRGDGVDMAEPRIVAVTGWTTDELEAGMDAAHLQPGYDLVTLLIGVNDQYRGRPPEAYDGPFKQLLERAIALAGGKPSHVVVVSIPDWGVTAFGHKDARGPAQIGHELDAYNAIAAKAVRAAGAHWVDITPVSREAGDAPDMLAADGLHPSAAQYTRWMRVIEPTARRVLSGH
ncbi:SGNH/GDSL hydrolase family protein [Oleiagrimonas sp. C23AA]|uniref:SGNH/GDSL hydrolase family protein n=1 Tax=Oleiagrimonas sp. C23AA TaxID=2719047 RepID=UPI00141DA1D5|nr:SGNH/GDSL hydrolase family protein [Oleiagrimonas sp. C23AA]NII11954.1 SGNH/GDSL hydrolase family protein [Oleiagrimonas sp. C23AA]